MTKQNLISIAVRGVMIAGLVCWLLAASPTAVAQAQPDISGTYEQISLKNMTRDQAVRLYVERGDADHDYDWKVALNFYGKVVDENNNPVSGAKVHLSWVTLNDPNGGKEGDILSEGNGLFSLTNQAGKNLEVLVQKEGYYSVEGDRGILAFEYADPSDSRYYEPDPKKPVVFHLRKKGVGAKLFSTTLLLHFKDHRLDAHVNLMRGFIKPDGMLGITSDTSKFLPGAQAFPWTVALNMSEGGLVETNDQYPFQAPIDGYNPTAAMVNMINLDRSVWRGDVKKTYYFYLPSTNTYGRLTVTASCSTPLTLDYSYNPTPGDRYLEPASK